MNMYVCIVYVYIYIYISLFLRFTKASTYTNRLCRYTHHVYQVKTARFFISSSLKLWARSAPAAECLCSSHSHQKIPRPRTVEATDTADAKKSCQYDVLHSTQSNVLVRALYTQKPVAKCMSQP